MTDLIKVATSASLPTLLAVIGLFGFAPGFCLRLIVLAYPRNDPRRTELIAELYAVPRLERPVWVGEQIEVALFEGLANRIRASIQRRISAIRRSHGTRTGHRFRIIKLEQHSSGRRVALLEQIVAPNMRIGIVPLDEIDEKTYRKLIKIHSKNGTIDLDELPRHRYGHD